MLYFVIESVKSNSSGQHKYSSSRGFTSYFETLRASGKVTVERDLSQEKDWSKSMSASPSQDEMIAFLEVSSSDRSVARAEAAVLLIHILSKRHLLASLFCAVMSASRIKLPSQ